MAKLFLSESDIQKLLELARHNRRDFALFHTAFSTGFRASDLLNLKRWDVAPDGRVVRFLKIKMQKTKGMVERTLSPACQKAIERYLGVRADNNPFLFISESSRGDLGDRKMHRGSLHRIVKAYLSQMYDSESLRGNACHTTRRSIAQLISQKSGRIEAASRFLGHTSVSNTILYLNCDQFNKDADNIVAGMEWSASP